MESQTSITTQFLPESPDLSLPPQTPKKSPLIPILIGVVIAVLIGIIALLTSQNNILKNQSITPSPTSQITNTTYPDDRSTIYPTRMPTSTVLGSYQTTTYTPNQCGSERDSMITNFQYQIPSNMTETIKNEASCCTTYTYSSPSLSIEATCGDGFGSTMCPHEGYESIQKFFNTADHYIDGCLERKLDELSGQWVITSDQDHDYGVSIAISIDGKDTPANRQIITQFLSSFKAISSPEIIIISPSEGTVIESPVMVKGTAPKGWTFESIINISIEDDQHQLLSGGPVSTEEIEGSDNLVSFNTAINFASTTDTGYITVKNDNPSGLPENDKSFSLPIKFAP